MAPIIEYTHSIAIDPSSIWPMAEVKNTTAIVQNISAIKKNATELNSMVSLSVSERRAFSIFNVRYLRHILYMAWRSMFCWVVFILRMADVGRGYGNS